MTSRVLKLIFQIAIFKTLYVNMCYFKIKTALRLPIIIFKKTSIKHIKRGNIKLSTRPFTAMMMIGIPSVEFFTGKTVLDIDGKLELGGKTRIGSGCYIVVGNNASLQILGDFEIKASGKLMITHKAVIGKNCLFSWDVTLMDTDWHKIYSSNNNKIINPSKPIIINDNVWIGCNSTILKGVQIAKNVIIGANSLITKSILEDNCIATSERILKSGVYWTK